MDDATDMGGDLGGDDTSADTGGDFGGDLASDEGADLSSDSSGSDVDSDVSPDADSDLSSDMGQDLNSSDTDDSGNDEFDEGSMNDTDSDTETGEDLNAASETDSTESLDSDTDDAPSGDIPDGDENLDNTGEDLNSDADDQPADSDEDTAESTSDEMNEQSGDDTGDGNSAEDLNSDADDQPADSKENTAESASDEMIEHSGDDTGDGNSAEDLNSDADEQPADSKDDTAEPPSDETNEQSGDDTGNGDSAEDLNSDADEQPADSEEDTAEPSSDEMDEQSADDTGDGNSAEDLNPNTDDQPADSKEDTAESASDEMNQQTADDTGDGNSAEDLNPDADDQPADSKEDTAESASDVANDRTGEQTSEVPKDIPNEIPTSSDLVEGQNFHPQKDTASAFEFADQNYSRSSAHWQEAANRHVENLNLEMEDLNKSLPVAKEELDSKYHDVWEYINSNELTAETAATDSHCQELMKNYSTARNSYDHLSSRQRTCMEQIRDISESINPDMKTTFKGMNGTDFNNSYKDYITEKQGNAVDGYGGVCGIDETCSIVNQQTGSDLGEERGVKEYIAQGLCETNGSFGDKGGTSAVERSKFLDSKGLSFQRVDLYNKGAEISLDDIAARFNNGESAGLMLKAQDLSQPELSSRKYDLSKSFIENISRHNANHATTIAGFSYDKSGRATGVWLNDTGGWAGSNRVFIDADKFHQMQSATKGFAVEFSRKR